MQTTYYNSTQDSNSKYIQFPYSHIIELQMVTFYQILSEKGKRLYAANEALKLGYGGICYISQVLNCDRKTIYKGITELKHPDAIEKGRVRAIGGGRKQSFDSIPGLHKNFLEVLWDYTAGDPMDEKIKWTNLTHQQIADKLKEKEIDVSRKIVKQLFKKHGYKKRKAQKAISAGVSSDQNEQFENIAELKSVYIAACKERGRNNFHILL